MLQGPYSGREPFCPSVMRNGLPKARSRSSGDGNINPHPRSPKWGHTGPDHRGKGWGSHESLPPGNTPPQRKGSKHLLFRWLEAESFRSTLICCVLFNTQMAPRYQLVGVKARANRTWVVPAFLYLKRRPMLSALDTCYNNELSLLSLLGATDTKILTSSQAPLPQHLGDAGRDDNQETN